MVPGRRETLVFPHLALLAVGRDKALTRCSYINCGYPFFLNVLTSSGLGERFSHKFLEPWVSSERNSPFFLLIERVLDS